MSPRADSEAAFQAQVIGIARYAQWRIYHAPAGGKAGKVDREQRGRGFPDLVLLKPPRLIFAELKTERGVIRPDQELWLADLTATSEALAGHVEASEREYGPDDDNPGVEVYLWRPADLETIAGILSPGDGNAAAFARDRA